MYFLVGDIHNSTAFMRSVICGVQTILLLSNMSATGQSEEEMMIDNHVILSAHQIYNIASLETVNVLNMRNCTH